jgi:hypothetical protein
LSLFTLVVLLDLECDWLTLEVVASLIHLLYVDVLVIKGVKGHVGFLHYQSIHGVLSGDHLIPCQLSFSQLSLVSQLRILLL